MDGKGNRAYAQTHNSILLLLFRFIGTETTPVARTYADQHTLTRRRRRRQSAADLLKLASRSDFVHT